MRLAAQSWESIGMIYTLLPLMVLIMMISIMSKTIERVTEPEFVREIKPIAEEAVRMKMLAAGK